MKELTQMQRLEKETVWLIRQKEFVSYIGVFMMGDVRVEPDPAKCPTAYTDGLNVVYGEKFLEGLSAPQVRAVILHENIHKMLEHVNVWKHLWQENKQLTNISADFVVNGIIKEAGCAGVEFCPEMAALYDPDLSHNKSVQEVYNILKKNSKKIPQLGELGGSSNGGGSFDEHGFEEAAARSKEEMESIKEQIDYAVRQGAILAGQLGGEVDRNIGELLKVPLDPWAILRKFLTDTCVGEGELSYSRPNRRFLQFDMIMPTEICETLPHIVFGVDTSGSIGGETLTWMLSNVAHIFKTINPDKVDLLYWDTAVAGVENYARGELDQMVASTLPKGGGGTNPSCVFDYLKKEKENPTVVVMLTDGYFYGDSVPDIGVPTIWLVYQNESFIPPFGSVAHI